MEKQPMWNLNFFDVQCILVGRAIFAHSPSSSGFTASSICLVGWGVDGCDAHVPVIVELLNDQGIGVSLDKVAREVAAQIVKVIGFKFHSAARQSLIC